MPSDDSTALDVFFSYSHHDEKLRDALEIHLAPLKRDRSIRAWHDRKIAAGRQWEGEIVRQLNSADLVLLLISPDFLASNFCVDREMVRALERHAAGEARVVPVILRPADWQTEDFVLLQALPRDGKPVTKWRNRDEAFVEIARGLREVIAELQDARGGDSSRESPEPAYPDDATRELSESLKDAYWRRAELNASGGDKTAVVEDISRLQGAQLKTGDSATSLVPSAAPRVFISYSHDSPEHSDRVLTLADRLRLEGIDAQIDQYEEAPPGGWQLRMEDELEAADFILVIATETYERRRHGREEKGKGHGVRFEGAILSQTLYEQALHNESCVPVVFSSDDRAHIPVYLRASTYYDLETGAGYEALYRRLTSQRAVLKPAIGKSKDLPPKKRRGVFEPTASCSDEATRELSQDDNGARTPRQRPRTPREPSEADAARPRSNAPPSQLEKAIANEPDWQKRRRLIERVPADAQDAAIALATLDRLRCRTRNGNDLFFLERATVAVAEKWRDAEHGAEDLRHRLYDHIPAPSEDLFRWIVTRDGRVPLWRDIYAGSFLMGSPKGEKGTYDDELPRHTVVVRSPFRMAVVPVTITQYAAFDPEHRSYHQGKVTDEQIGLHPVESVSWYEACAFCRWLSPRLAGARLPTEDEWEYACRAGTETRYWNGDDSALGEVAWYAANSDYRTHRVGRKLANPWDLYDVHGNVSEWTASQWTTDYSGRKDGVEVDPSVPAAASISATGGLRVDRGGCYNDSARDARSTCRVRNRPWESGGDLGFRVLQTAAR